MANSNQDLPKKLGLYMLILGWILIITLVWILYSKVLFAPKSTEIYMLNGTSYIKLYPERDGHYRISASINQTKVNFLIDTGATNLAIPLNLAKKLNLTLGKETRVITASGRSKAYLTNIDKLKIENVILSNVRALIIEDMRGETALLGMNVLNQFKMEQTKDYLLLEAKQP